ncbi:2081_t:CDS:2 [Paraglomus brasilianum]|uniref:2081_t:CDS:1 n=1 Tax=Paraglomus brasilianum TaxID=144538 RepID=A0A9N8W0V3_9GLOM|nr:2081_t:CDS:2 [Paraglomus brasilianum]
MSPRPYNTKDKIYSPPKDILNRPFIKCALTRYTPSIIMHAPALSINYTLGGHYRQDDRAGGEEKDEAFYLAVEEKKENFEAFLPRGRGKEEKVETFYLVNRGKEKIDAAVLLS